MTVSSQDQTAIIASSNLLPKQVYHPYTNAIRCTLGLIRFNLKRKKYTSQQDLLLHLTTVDHFRTINLESALAKMPSENQVILHSTIHQEQDNSSVRLNK